MPLKWILWLMRIHRAAERGFAGDEVIPNRVSVSLPGVFAGGASRPL